MWLLLRWPFILVFGVLLVAACTQPEATPTPTLTPTARPTPTPTPTPEERLKAAADRMAALSSLSFTLTHEEGSTPLMVGVELQKAQGVVALPDRASLDVEAIVTALRAFLSLKIVVDGAQASMTDPLTGAPRELPADSLPFNFLNLGVTLGDIARALRDPVYTTSQEIDGVMSRGIAGSILGQDLSSLIPVAVRDAHVGLEMWVGEDDLIRRVRIAGPVVSSDSLEVVRNLILGSFDQPVTITPLS